MTETDGGSMNSEATSYFSSAVSVDVGFGKQNAGQSVIGSDGAHSKIVCPLTVPVREPDNNDRSQIAGFTDEILLEELRTCNKEALAILFHRYARLVRAVAYRILRDASEADDLVQEVFLFVYRKGSMFDARRGSARSWIVQVAYTQAIDRRRYLTTRRFYTRLELSDTAALARSRSVFYEESIEGVLGRERLRRIGESLSEDQRRVLELYFYEGYTLEEVAKEMTQTVGNIRNHYYRCLEKMRRQIFETKLKAK
jgi:RNA polymerase sigma-70 factor (ECF subfamily)